MLDFSEILVHFDRLYGQLPIPIIVIDEHRTVRRANNAFCRLTEQIPEEAIHRSADDYFKKLADFFQQEQFPGLLPEYSRTELSCPNAESLPVRLNICVAADHQGSVCAALVLITDLRETEQTASTLQELTLENQTYRESAAGKAPEEIISEKIQLERDLNGMRSVFEGVLESCGDGILLVDLGGTIRQVNKSFAAMLGMQPEELAGKKSYELGPLLGEFVSTTGEHVVLDQSYCDYQTERIEALQEMLDSGRGILDSWDLYAYHRNGRVVPLDLTVSIRKTSSGTTAGTVTSVRDLTKKKQAEEALLQAYQFRNQFFTNITHALRTPLTLTIGPLESLLGEEFGSISTLQREQIELALRNARQLLRLINQLLDLSRINSGFRDVMLIEKNLQQLIGRVVDSFRFIAQKKNIALEFKPGSVIPSVLIDPVKIEKSLFNIIGNAFKFTPDGGCIRIELDCVREPDIDRYSAETVVSSTSPFETIAAAGSGCIRIAVTDTGIGVSPQELTGIFARFSQGRTHASSPDSGTGIGLAHTREIVELMGGSITATSKPDHGSTFAIYLPIGDKRTKPMIDDDLEPSALRVQPDIEMADVFNAEDRCVEQLSGEKPLVLVLDDNPDVRTYITLMLRDDYDFITARNGAEGLERMRAHRPDIILCDIMMPEMDGNEFLHHVRQNPDWQNISFIFLTARADTEMKIQSLEQGADDYIVKPFNALELLARLKSLLRIRELQQRTALQTKTIHSLTSKLQNKYVYGNIIGSSAPMRKLFQTLESIRDSEATVLITGETGTGKELVANSIHYNSPRKNKPLISVNCGAIPRELMEREFFGHVKGAYTGAVNTKKGYFAEADGGTLFLDEIAEMDRDMQVKLLRVLEHGEMVRVGDSRPVRVDVRLIAATNKDLQQEVRQGNFREDLYYRIYVLPLHMPPLRERSGDIPLLIEHFIQRMHKKTGRDFPPLPKRDMQLFLNYRYPGNVRELENIIERYCLLGLDTENLFAPCTTLPDGPVTQFPYDELLASSNPLKAAAQKAKLHAEKEIILHVLQVCNNDFSEAARMLNIGLSSLYRKLKEIQ
jgi:DNA-binding NtrC family response regulator/signal transduction histidine kinase